MASKKKKSTNPFKSVRFDWSRDPVEKPHSTKKGEKGYKRKKIDVRRLDDVIEEESP